MSRLASKIAIVTGAARGIGQGIAERFVAEGAQVVWADILGDQVKEAAAASGSARSVAYELDVADEEQVAGLFAFVDERFGRIDVLVNNAAIVDIGPILEKEVGEFDRVFDVNVRGIFLCSQQASRRMAATGGGSIVNISSLAAWLADHHTASYVASKGATEAMTRGFAVPLGAQGVRVNSVAPGIVETAMNIDQFDENPGHREEAASHIPLGRFGHPEDIANAVLFLASDEAQWITGATLVVDGGLACQFAPKYTRDLPDGSG